jgi:ABC-2 type transport system ATP-binding protein
MSTDGHALELQGLEVGFGRTEVLKGVDFALPRNTTTVLLGRNGAGKTTLLRAALGLLRPTAGSVTLLGGDIHRAPAPLLARTGFVPDRPDVPRWMTPTSLGAFEDAHFGAASTERRAALFERLEVPATTRFGALSRGQGMKAMLAVAIAREPELLLLDEPFGGLDPVIREEMVDAIIEGLLPGPTTVLLTTHELEPALRLAERVAVLREGVIAHEGSLDEIVSEARGDRASSALRGLFTEPAREGSKA